MEIDELYPLISQVELIKYAKLFCQEIILGLANKPSSLPCILNPVSRLIPSPGFGVAVSIGGTNGYASAFRINKKGVLKFLNRRLFSLPEEMTKEELFHLITKNILEITKDRKRSFPIGIGFAYPLKPVLTHRFLDGELLYMSKGRNIKGLVGKRIGQEYHKFLIAEYGIDTTISVANDAICLLLGGSGVDLSGVVGTGLNFAYFEKRKAIASSKLGELVNFSQKEIAVNLEAKNFDKIKGTPLREIVDEKSDDRGFSLAEKEAAGAYLYQIFNAGREKIVGKNFPVLSSTDQLNEIIIGSFLAKIKDNPPKKFFSSRELEKAKIFARRIFQRSAQIVAIEICGILLKLGKTKGVIPIVMDGGLFWKARDYHSLVNLYVNSILPEVIPSFTRLFGSARRGIALLARSASF